MEVRTGPESSTPTPLDYRKLGEILMILSLPSFCRKEPRLGTPGISQGKESTGVMLPSVAHSS